MVQPKHVLLFGDQTENIVPTLKDLYRRSKSSLYLKHFLQSALDAVSREASEYSLSEQTRLRATSFVELADSLGKDQYSDVCIRTLLLCVAQLGSLVTLLENNPRLLDSKTSHNLIALGFCTGLLPAAVVSCTSSMIELLAVSPQIVLVSLRMGTEAYGRSQLLEESQESWAVAVSGISRTKLQTSLEKFNNDKAIPSQKIAYISSVSGLSVTISGPPSTLKQLFALDLFDTATTFPLPITAAFHASHLPTPETDKIILPNSQLSSLRLEEAQIISTSSGSCYQPQTLEKLLSSISDEIFKNLIDNEEVLKQLVHTIDGKNVLLTAVGPNATLKRTTKALEEAGVHVQVQKPEIFEQPAFEDIAIVGMSGRFPGAETLEEFWNVLESGLDLHRQVPSDRFDIKTHYDPTGKTDNTTSTPYGCFIDRPGVFDARLFNMSPREAAQTDPGQRLLLMTTYEALEMSGYSQEHDLDDRDPRVGSFFGQTIDDWKEYNAAENVDMYYVTGGIRAFSAGRVNYHFKWEGPSYSVDSACSSSLLAVQLACSSLLARECNMAVAGGSNILTGCNMFSGLSKGSFLSQTGSCKTFDSEADGYCRGDGVGVVVLKRLDDAISNRDNILAVVKAVATNHSAQAISITHPHVETQQKLFEEVLLNAAIDPSEVDYVEMHGTGTQAGDAAESKSIMNVLAKKSRSNPLTIGSLKPNVGHGEAVAGVTSLIKTLMMLRKDRIIPHIGVKGSMNPKLPAFADYNVHIASSKPFQSRNGKRTIMLNNFSAAGGNTSLLMVDGEQPVVEGIDPRSTHVVTVSAKTSFSMKQNMVRLQDFVKTSDVSLQDIAYTTTARRLHHSIRQSFAVKNLTELSSELEKCVSQSNNMTPINEAPPVVFLFPGQGAKVMGIANDLYRTSAFFRGKIEEYNHLCEQQNLPSFLTVLTGNTNEVPTPTQNQLCMVAIELALASLWQSWGIVPSVVIGHSLGEYAALCVAGVLSTSDMLFLVAKRAEQMQLHCTAHTHSMLSTRLSAEDAEIEIRKANLASLEIACKNTQNSTVISGASKEITSFQEMLQAKDVVTKVLEVPYSFHSRQMDSIMAPYEAIAQNVHFAGPKIPVASTLLGKVVTTSGVFSAQYLVRQARNSVNFPGALNSCLEERLVTDKTLWLEAGPGAVCLSFARAVLSVPMDRTLTSMEADKDCWFSVSKSLSQAYRKGSYISWTEYHKEHKNALRLVELPTYAFDLKNYWIEYRSRLGKGEAVTEPARPAFTSTCLQQITDEFFDASGARVVFSSDFGDPVLSKMARGHVVCGLGLCPSSVYAEMAFSAATYIFQKRDSSVTVPPMDLADMEIFNPFVVKSDTPNQIFRATAQQDSSGPVKIEFHSQEGGEWKQHARCTVTLCDSKSMMSDWNSNSYLVRARAKTLKEMGQSGDVHKILRKMAYKLFKTVVDYSEKYQALDETFMNGDQPEASATLRFQTSADEGTYTHSPYWIDSLAQLGGFCLNVNPPSGEDVVFLSHGWKSMKIIGSLSEKAQYTSYVHMQKTDEPGVYAGNVYMFNEKEVVAVCSGLKFKQMKKSLLETLLGVSTRKLLPSATFPKPAPKTIQKVNSAPVQSSSTGFNEILEVISSEAGLDQSEFTEDAMWSELGIDSILTISILSKLRSITALDIPSSLFTNCPTKGDLHAYFNEHLQAAPPAKPLPQAVREVQADYFNTRSRSLSAASTVYSRNSSRESSPEPFSSPDTVFTPNVEDVGAVLKGIIIEELGIQPSEAQPSTLFSDLGMDSLLTISVLGSLREKTGTCLPSSFFTENQTFSDLDRFYHSPPLEVKAVSASLAEVCGFISKPVLLQGIPSPGAQCLFILPDGSGSALSYIDLPVVSKSLPVYALNSPFYKNTDQYTISFESVAAIFVNAIRTLQPHGPYLIAGWSMGGIFAYEVSRQLMEAGDEIELLVFIDSPCPRTLPPLPAPTLDILDKAGLFDGLDKSGKGIPETTRQHFLASVRTLEHFDPIALKLSDKLKKVIAIWAKDGMLEGVSEQKRIALTDDEIASEAKNWLFGVRSDYGPAGWDNLVGRDVECHIVGGNHFSIMKSPQVASVGTILSEALSGF